MRRCWKWLALLVFLAALGLGDKTPLARPQVKAARDNKPNPRKKVRKKSQVVELLKQLQEPVNLEKGIDSNTPLKDALDFLSEHYNLTFLIDPQAFQEEMDEGDRAEVEAAPVCLPKMTNVSLGTALRLLLSKVPPRGATFLVRDGYIEVTTPRRAAAAYLWRRKVLADFDQAPLREALEELSGQTGASILVDPRVGDKANTPVTATLKNDVTLATAVILLADMADLKAVRVGGTLYVTTPEKAAALRAEEGRKKTRADKPRSKRRPV